MAIEVIMPSLGFDMVEGTVSRWLKDEGDPVRKGEVIVENVDLSNDDFPSEIIERVKAG